jgi:hypothetical protein
MALSTELFGIILQKGIRFPIVGIVAVKTIICPFVHRVRGIHGLSKLSVTPEAEFLAGRLYKMGVIGAMHLMTGTAFPEDNRLVLRHPLVTFNDLGMTLAA